MNKPVTITTPTHALAVAIYFFQAALGICQILDLATAKAMIGIVGQIPTDLWALLLIMAGIMAAFSVLTAHKTPVRALQIEFWSVLTVGLLNVCYELSLLVGMGLGEALTTQLFTTSVAIGCIARAMQARRDRMRVIRSMHSSTVAVVAGEKEEG